MKCVCFGIFVFALIYLYGIDAVCCPKKPIRFVNNAWPGKKCADFNGFKLILNNHCGIDYRQLCGISICGHGRPPGEGTYCGIGSCNMFGCNCDYGCFGGIPENEFKRIYGKDVSILANECFHFRSLFGYDTDDTFDIELINSFKIIQKKNCKSKKLIES